MVIFVSGGQSFLFVVLHMFRPVALVPVRGVIVICCLFCERGARCQTCCLAVIVVVILLKKKNICTFCFACSRNNGVVTMKYIDNFQLGLAQVVCVEGVSLPPRFNSHK
jgi:hypothetical protein